MRYVEAKKAEKLTWPLKDCSLEKHPRYGQVCSLNVGGPYVCR